MGDFKNPGREWHPQGRSGPVRVHDFEIGQPENGKAAPYGVYDLGRSVGWVSVGVDHDTAEFAVESIRRWWRWMGSRRYSKAQRLLITADSGGSHGARVRLWKWELQQPDETGLEIAVCHFSAGRQQMEQDRTPSLLFHQSELARQAADQSSGHYRPDRRNHHKAGTPSVRSANVRTPTSERKVPWRLEL